MKQLTPLQQLIDNLKIIQSATHTTEQHRAFNICIGEAEKFLEPESRCTASA